MNATNMSLSKKKRANKVYKIGMNLWAMVCT